MAVRTRRFKVVEGPAAGAHPPRLELSLRPLGAMPVPPSGERVEGQNPGACPPDATKSLPESHQRDVNRTRIRRSHEVRRNPLQIMDLRAAPAYSASSDAAAGGADAAGVASSPGDGRSRRAR